MQLIKAVRNKIPTLSARSDDDVETLIDQAKRNTIVLRSILKVSVIFIFGFLYLLAKTYLLDKGYSRIASIVGSFFIIAFAFYLVAIIDEKFLLANIKKNL